MQKNLPVVTHGGKQGLHILQIPLRFHSLGDIVISCHETVLPSGVVDDLLFLHRRDPAVVQPQGNPGSVGKLGKNRLLLCGGGILPDNPHTAVGVAHNAIIGKELYGSRQNAVKEILCSVFLSCILCFLLFSKQAHFALTPFTYWAPSTSDIRSPSMEAPK